MAYSALAHSLPEFIRQPTTIAFLGSLGLHGLFAMSFSQQTPLAEPIPDPIKVVELTPAEQSRLSQSQSQLPPSFTPQTPLPSNQPPSLSNLFPNLPPGKSSTVLPPGGTFSRNLPLNTQPANPWYWSLPPRQSLPSNNNNKPKVTVPPVPDQGTVTPGPTVKNSALDGLIGAQTPAPSTSAPEATPTPTPSATPPVAAKRPDKIPQEAINRMRELQAQKRAAGQSDGNGQPGDAEAATGELEKWMTQNNFAGLEGMVEVVASNPQNVKGTVVVAVAVDSDGKILDGSPKVVQSSGNKSLDQAALEAAKNQTLAPPKQGQVYLIVVKFSEETSATFSPSAYGA